MKILYFHQHFTTPKGASGIRSYEMARALIAAGHQVTMVCGSAANGVTGLSAPFKRGMREGEVEGIQVVEFNLAYANADGFLKRSWLFLSFALRSIGVAMRRDYDLIFATTTPLTAGIPGIFARWLWGKPFVFEVRDLWPELPREMGVIRNPIVLALMSALEWCSYRSAHRLIGLSPGIVAGIERCGVAPERIAMVPNGCDLGIFAAPKQIWRPVGASSSDMLAVFCGTHGQANGLDAVLDVAAELLRRARRDITIVLIGEGKLKPDLQARAQQEGLDNLIFHPLVPKAELAGLLGGADLGLQILADVPAFYFGTSPNKFFDYIAAGLPVLNNYPGWLADMIEQQNCGFVVEPGNAVAFADALEAAADNRERLKEMGAQARRLAEDRFARKRLAGEFVHWLEQAKTACTDLKSN